MTLNKQSLELLGALANAADKRNSVKADKYNYELLYAATRLLELRSVENVNYWALRIQKLIKRKPK